MVCRYISSAKIITFGFSHKSKLFCKSLNNKGFLSKKVWISFHQMQHSNDYKMSKTRLFNSISTNLFPFLTRESQNKIQTFLSENALNKGSTIESLDFSKLWICGNVYNWLSYGVVDNSVCRMWESCSLLFHVL